MLKKTITEKTPIDVVKMEEENKKLQQRVVSLGKAKVCECESLQKFKNGFLDNVIENSGFKFCPWCGGKIKEVQGW